MCWIRSDYQYQCSLPLCACAVLQIHRSLLPLRPGTATPHLAYMGEGSCKVSRNFAHGKSAWRDLIYNCHVHTPPAATEFGNWTGLGRCIIPSKAPAGRKEQRALERTGWPSKGDAQRGGSEPSQMLAVPFLPASKNRNFCKEKRNNQKENENTDTRLWIWQATKKNQLDKGRLLSKDFSAKKHDFNKTLVWSKQLFLTKL